MVPTSILDLPSELMADIFSRIPITAIFRSKAVCKLWKTYILNPEFFTAQPNHYVSLILYDRFRLSCTVAVLKPNEAAVTTVIKNGRLILPHRRDRLVGSCNGLVCILHSRNQLIVSNPMTRELHWLPLFHKFNKDDYHKYEHRLLFGFSNQTKEYKAVWIYKQRDAHDRQTQALICTVDGSGDEAWRAVVDQHLPLPFNMYQCDTNGVTFNGDLLWIAIDEDYPGERYELVSFDIAEEKVQHIHLPLEIYDNVYGIGLGILRDCLCIYQPTDTLFSCPTDQSGRVFNAWSMMDQSWMKETITIPLGRLDWFPTYYAFAHLSDDELVTVCDDTNMVLLNRKENTSTQLLEQVDRNVNLIPFVPSFLPLNHLIKGKR